MNKDESLALYAQGRQAWNAWADKMFAEREALVAAGTWTGGQPRSKWNDATRTWHKAARSDFKEHNFEEDVNFIQFVFPGDAEFDCAAFSGNAKFDRAIFSGKAGFEWVNFSGIARFSQATFSEDAVFDGTTFSGAAEFTGASFRGAAGFDQAMFSGAAWFHRVTFSVGVVFQGAAFSDTADFVEVAFLGAAWMHQATFSRGALFDRATLSGDAWFVQTVFGGFTRFDEANFENHASFTAIEGKTAFSLTGATFKAMPDFIQAHFAEAPRLDDVQIEPWSGWPSTWAEIKMQFKGDPELAARWRALKRLAVQGHDHAREMEFFKGELKARRWVEDRPWHAVFWFGILYQIFSDFGRSLVRPLLWWLANVVLFAGLYLGEYLAKTGLAMTGFAWMLKWVGGTAPPLTCIAGPDDPFWAAVQLSLRKGLLFLGLDSTDKLNQIYGCLYGVHTGEPVTQGAVSQVFPASFSPVIPDFVAFLGLAQLLISAVLIFLFLLALRNHFRIK